MEDVQRSVNLGMMSNEEYSMLDQAAVVYFNRNGVLPKSKKDLILDMAKNYIKE